MKNLILLIIMSIGVPCCGAYANPVDRGISHVLKWEDTHKAGKYSDYLDIGLMIAPYVYATKEEEKYKAMATIGLLQFTNANFGNTVKVFTKRMRPNGKNDRSFFSGHTQQAFLSAGMICSMDKDSCPYFIGLASIVGYLRIASGWHWASDVVVGAGVGYYSGKYIPKIIIGF